MRGFQTTEVVALPEVERIIAEAEAERDAANRNVLACQGDLTRLFAFKQAAVPILRDAGLLDRVHEQMEAR